MAGRARIVVAVAKRRTVVAFGLLLCCPRVSKVSTATGDCGVLVAKCRTVVALGIAGGPRVSKMSTVTGIQGAVVAKRRSVNSDEDSGCPVSGLDVSKGLHMFF